jgi:hypothetical protein
LTPGDVFLSHPSLWSFCYSWGQGQGQGQGLTKALNNLDLNYILKYSEGQKKTCIKLVSFPSF